MVVLRCTRTLLQRLKREPVEQPPVSATLLGDFYATLVIARPFHLVLGVSERSLLPVVCAAAPASDFVARWRNAVGEVLRALKVAEPAIESELREMADVTLAVTANRRVLGSLNDFRRMLPSYLEHGQSLLEASLQLSKAPCGPIGMDSPRRLVVELFAGAST